jgi:hypothetical protein
MENKIMADKKTIDITPKGMQTHEGIRRVNEALEKRNQADFQCYVWLKHFLKTAQNDPGAFTDFLFKVLNIGHDDPGIVIKDYIDKLQKAIDDREERNEQFLDAIAGR